MVLALAVVLVAHSSEAAPFDVNDETWEGCSELLRLARQELGEDRVEVLSVLDWEELDADDGVMVVHPTHALDAEEAASFMKAGGRMAVLDDYGEGDKLLEHFKISRRALPSEPRSYLRNNPALAVATPAFDKAGGEVLGLHPTVADVKQVVLNHGTGLIHPDLTPVLEVQLVQGDPVAVAVAGQIDGPKVKGRLFAAGDPSTFINLMMRYPGNRAFASGVVHYLADGDATDERDGRLIIVANDFDERGSFGGVTPLRKAIDRKVEAAVEVFEELRDDGFPWWLHVLVAALTALVLCTWVFRSLVRLYASRVPRYARPLPLVAQGGAAGRAAVLASDVSPPALALLEVKHALGEVLAQHLGRPPGTSVSNLLDEAAGAGVPSELGGRLRDIVRSMRAAEDALVAGAPPRVGRAEVLEASRAVEELFDALGIADGGAPRPRRGASEDG